MTEIDLRLQYKSETGQTPIATKRKTLDWWSQDRRPFGGFPLSTYGLWLEEKVLELIGSYNYMDLRIKYWKESGYDPTWRGTFSRTSPSGEGLTPEYITWLEETYLRYAQN